MADDHLDAGELEAMLEDATQEATGDLVGTSRAMRRVHDLIERAAPGKATILVRGETGTGKELVAREIHRRSDRSGGPLVVVHCGALPDNLLEAELFGHERGAFTGADKLKKGRIELAETGTVFLDEIGDVSPAVQVKLLRLLQEKTFERLGGTQPIRADVRFIAATHRNLENMVKGGEFREDLFYRLNVVPIWVPPLRARRGDTPMLVAHFCDRLGPENGRPGITLSEEAMSFVVKRRWPGNVRQLQNFIERLVVLARDDVVELEDVKRELSEGSPFSTDVGTHASRAERLKTEATALRRTAEAAVQKRPPDEGDVKPLEEQIRAAERRAVQEALEAARGNRSKAARLLGISRQTLYNKLKEYGLMEPS
jgi:two-component system response regulator AtoC